MPNNQPVPEEPKGNSKEARQAVPKTKSSQGRHYSREELSRHERETRAQRLLLAAMAVVTVLVVAILGFGWWREYSYRGSDAVATVSGQAISANDYARQLDFQRKSLDQQISYYQAQYQSFANQEGGDQLAQYIQQQIAQMQYALAALPDQVLDQMVNELVIRQEAARRGLKVTPEEIDAEIAKTFGGAPAAAVEPTTAPDANSTAAPAATAAAGANATPAAGSTAAPATTPASGTTASAAATPAAAAAATPAAGATTQPAANPTDSVPPTPAPTVDPKERLASMLSQFGMTEAEYRKLVETDLLYQKLVEDIGASVPTTAEQIHARHILVDNEDKAKEIVAKSRAGADFAEIAKTESTDSGSKDNGGDLGWFPKGQMVTEFDDAAFSLEVNQISDPVKTTYGYHIIQVIEKDPNRKLDDTTIASKKQEAFSNWITEALKSPDVKKTLSADQKAWAFKKIGWAPPSQTSQP